MTAPDSAKLEIYKYVRDLHDKLIAARQGQKARLSSFLVLTGPLLTVVFTFAVPSTLSAVERSAALDRDLYRWAVPVALLPLAWLMYYLARGLWAIISVLSHVRLNLADAAEGEKMLNALEADELDGDGVVFSLTANVLDAVPCNLEDNYAVG